MKVTISELRSMIREALEEKMMSEGEDEGTPSMSPAGTGLDEEMQQEGWHELEEAWNELEEVSGLHEAAAKKEKAEDKKAKEEKKPAKKEEKPAPKETGMSITKTQLMKALDLKSAQEIDFKRAIKKGHSVADALAAATKEKAAKEED